MSTVAKTPNYNLSQVAGPDIPDWITDYTSDMSKIDAALKENADDIATVRPDEFSEESTYAAGDYCIKDNVIYKAKTAVEAGAFDISDWTATTIFDELSGLNQKIQNKIQYDVAENENRDLYLMFQRVTDVEFVNGVGYVNNNLSGGDRVVRAFAQPESVTGVVIASCQAQSANNRMELHCINIDDGTPYSGSTVGYINLFILVTKGS